MAKHIDRRTFLKLTVAGAGGVLLSTSLTGCGFGGPPFDDGHGDLPNGYRFYRLRAHGDVVGGNGREMTIDQFFGTAHMSGGPHAEDVLTFSARDAGNRAAIVQMGLDLDGAQPQVQWQRTLVRSGDVLADGREVSRLGAMDVNEAGSVAGVLIAAPAGFEQHYGSGLYLAHEGDDFEPLLIAGDTFDDGARVAIGIIGDVDLHGDDLLVAAAHAPERVGTLPPGHSLLHLPSASLSAAQPVMTSGDVLAGTDHAVTDFGLLDVHDAGHFTVQTRTTSLLEHTPEQITTGAPLEDSSSIVSGNLAAPGDHDLVAAPSSLAAAAYAGQTHYGPRMLPDGRTLAIVHDGEREHLVLGAQRLLSSGDASPAGGSVLGFGPGSISPDGIVFYQLYSNVAARHALVATNGAEHRVVLERGDEVMNWGSPVEEILFGTTTHHVNGKHRLALLCSFADATHALVVGVPV
ncbi:MAG: hypothetical protein EA416_09955 [Trueperaceae bacterium]|nr:MAG: hypothetical protein EA416_09955 [Trueperaceae bacterium]